MKIIVHTGEKTREIACKIGDNLLAVLGGHGYCIAAPCGGRGTCKKCMCRLISGENIKTQNGMFLACQERVMCDMEIEVFEYLGSGLMDFHMELPANIDIKKGYSVALDIGTTTVAGYLLNMENGKIIDRFSFINPQASMGADVISRIAYAHGEGLGKLQNAIVNSVKQAIDRLKTEHKIVEISRTIVAANTTMLHLFSGTDPSSIGVIPFLPIFTSEKVLGLQSLDVGSREVVLLPSVSAFVGSDITAGVIATGLHLGKSARLLIDIGTNGEMVLSYKGKLYCCSTAAGPAFEGANISSGMGGVDGAINSCVFKNGRFEYTTVSGEARGICGSGLIDIVAELLGCKMIDETGALEDFDEVEIASGITVTQKDIREIQLAKSSIISGIYTLFKIAGVAPHEIEKVYVAGGFGFYMNLKNAIKIGLLPKEFDGKIEQAGNTAGKGAILALLSNEVREQTSEVAKSAEQVSLSGSAYFMQQYVENMMF